MNSYLYNQTTHEKSSKYIQENNEFISNPKCIYDYKRINYFQPIFGETFNKTKLLNKYINNNTSKEVLYNPSNKKNTSAKKKSKYLHTSLNKNKVIMKNKALSTKYQKEIMNNDSQTYEHINKKRKYQRCNSLAYIKKRPKDLIYYKLFFIIIILDQKYKYK